MRTIDKIKSYWTIGGFNLLLFAAEDKFFHGGNARSYIYKALSAADESEYPELLKAIWKLHFDTELNLDNPKSFNEKIQWMKLYDSTPIKTRLADKYLVREWIAEKIGKQYLVPLLGVWDKFDDIDFDKLPGAFALKCNHGSGMNLVVKDKSKLDKASAKNMFDKWMDTNFAFCVGLELHYKDIPRKIIAEKFIEQMDSNLLDYKIHVFKGEPKIIQIIGDRNLQTHKAKECFLTTDWVPEELMYHTYDMYETIPEKPANLDEMLRIAHVLGEGFRYVRVDLYDLDGQIMFGEMTFTPASGFGRWGGGGGGGISIFSRLMD